MHNVNADAVERTAKEASSDPQAVVQHVVSGGEWHTEPGRASPAGQRSMRRRPRAGVSRYAPPSRATLGDVICAGVRERAAALVA
jgi:hypothetical protein